MSEPFLKERGPWTLANKHFVQNKALQEQHHSSQKGCVYSSDTLLNVSSPPSEETKANIRMTENGQQCLNKTATDLTK